MGRTGRQGQKGTYILILNLTDLSKFNIEVADIENSHNFYKTLCEFRERKLRRGLQEINNNEGS
jgi:superfamily II DNA/RNA helicase